MDYRPNGYKRAREGYDKAKEMINSKFGKEVYKDSILKQWIKEENENQK